MMSNSTTRETTRTAPTASSSDGVEEENESKVNVSVFKNPIVHQLWTARQKAKKKSSSSSSSSSSPAAATTKSSGSAAAAAKPLESGGVAPSASRVEVSYPFSTDELLRESYCNPWGMMRFGKILEDLDALAGNIAFFHVDGGLDRVDGKEKEHPIIVTASFDRILLNRRPQSMKADQQLSGQVTWTGSSSMEIRMQFTDGGCQTCSPWLDAFVTFVTLDPTTKKPTPIPPVVPQTPEEETLFADGAARAAAKKRRRQQQKLQEQGTLLEIEKIARDLLQEAGPLLNMPSLADPHSILLHATKMQNALIAQPQVRNLHNRIFGGFLMRRAFELAFSTAYVFGGTRPIFTEVDEVSFASPVDVGDLLVFNSRIIYTDTSKKCTYYDFGSDPKVEEARKRLGGQLPLIHVEVETWVTEPEKVSARMSNQFYFTFAIASDKPIRRVLPANIDEARRMASRIVTDSERAEPTPAPEYVV